MLVLVVFNEDGEEEITNKATRYGITKGEALKIIIENALRVDGVDQLTTLTEEEAKSLLSRLNR